MQFDRLALIKSRFAHQAVNLLLSIQGALREPAVLITEYSFEVIPNLILPVIFQSRQNYNSLNDRFLSLEDIEGLITASSSLNIFKQIETLINPSATTLIEQLIIFLLP